MTVTDRFIGIWDSPYLNARIWDVIKETGGAEI